MTDERRNLVLVTADSVRADHCGYAGSTTGLTPAIDELASDGVGFTTAVAPGPRTPSSIPETMTGEPMPNDHVDPDDWPTRIARIRRHMMGATSLAERLDEAGYATVAYTANPYTGAHTAFDRGYDEFVEVGEADGRNLNVLAGTRAEPLTKYLDQWWNGKGFFARWDQFFDDVVASVQAANRPFFLWVFLLDAHNPYRAPRSVREETSTWSMYAHQIRANSLFKDRAATTTSSFRSGLSDRTVEGVKRAYRDAVRSVDRFVGDLRGALDEDDPVFAFHSDHGEAFHEHGTFGHQRQLYEENVRVPLVVGGTGESASVKQQVSLRDLADMLVAAALDERDVAADRWHAEQALLRTEDNSLFGLRTERWKYVLGRDGHMLYDLRSDPGETVDVADEHPDVAAELDASLSARIRQLPAGEDVAGDVAVVDDDVARRLRELGYVD